MRVHERFEQIYDPDNRHRKVKDDRFDRPIGELEREEDIETTDIDLWEDPNLVDIYKRYKQVQ